VPYKKEKMTLHPTTSDGEALLYWSQNVIYQTPVNASIIVYIFWIQFFKNHLLWRYPNNYEQNITEATAFPHSVAARNEASFAPLWSITANEWRACINVSTNITGQTEYKETEEASLRNSQSLR